MKEEEFLAAANAISKLLYARLDEAVFPAHATHDFFPEATELSTQLGSSLSVPWPYCLLALATLISFSLNRASAKMTNFLSAPTLPWFFTIGISGGGKSLPLSIVDDVTILLGKKKFKADL